MTPTIETIRPGVQFTPPAAASFRRAEADWGRPIDVNSTFRDPVLQLRMYNAWLAYVQGRGPRPGHSRALHPDESVHTKGAALDSDDWRQPGFISFMADHGWIRTAASDPTEQHHFEYQSLRDNHRNRPASGDSKPLPPLPPLVPVVPEEEDEDMAKNSGFKYTRASDGKPIILLINTTSRWWMEFQDVPAIVPSGVTPIAATMDTGTFAVVSEAWANAMKQSLDRA
jgi:hypothetical protein